MNKLFENEILNNYGGFTVLADVEEAKDDVNLAIKYNDHGDDFIFVRTKDGKTFEYGLFVTRNGYPDYWQLDQSWCQNYFVRKPKMYLKWDERSGLANEMFIHIKRELFDRDRFFGGPGDTIKKEYSKNYAQRVFEGLLEYVEKQKSKGIRFNVNSDKNDIMRYLEANDILTQENMELLKASKFDTRINGADGIAGKSEVRNDYVSGDSIERIIINGKEKDPSKISMKRTWDYYGVDGFGLSLGQFR